MGFRSLINEIIPIRQWAARIRSGGRIGAYTCRQGWRGCACSFRIAHPSFRLLLPRPLRRRPQLGQREPPPPIVTRVRATRRGRRPFGAKRRPARRLPSGLSPGSVGFVAAVSVLLWPAAWRFHSETDADGPGRNGPNRCWHAISADGQGADFFDDEMLRASITHEPRPLTIVHNSVQYRTGSTPGSSTGENHGRPLERRGLAGDGRRPVGRSP